MGIIQTIPAPRACASWPSNIANTSINTTPSDSSRAHWQSLEWTGRLAASVQVKMLNLEPRRSWLHFALMAVSCLHCVREFSKKNLTVKCSGLESLDGTTDAARRVVPQCNAVPDGTPLEAALDT